MNSTLKSIFLQLTVLACGFSVLNSCSQGSKEKEPTRGGSVIIKADVALRPTILELAQNYQQETAIKVQVKFASSQDMLVDAPGDSTDIYILANDNISSSMLDTVSLDPTSKRIMGYMIPCIIVPQHNPALVTSLADLTNNNVRLGISDPHSDVLGQFALEILKTNQVYDDLSDHLVIASSTQDLAERTARKELDAAIGWTLFPSWTQGGTDVVLLAASEIPRIAAVCARRSQVPVDSVQAAKLMTYLGSERALDVFRKWGYLITKTDIEMYASVANIGGTPE
jgi:molybdenum ABC transporter molybdate-binding protein